MCKSLCFKPLKEADWKNKKQNFVSTLVHHFWCIQRARLQVELCVSGMCPQRVYSRECLALTHLIHVSNRWIQICTSLFKSGRKWKTHGLQTCLRGVTAQNFLGAAASLTPPPQVLSESQLYPRPSHVSNAQILWCKDLELRNYWQCWGKAPLLRDEKCTGTKKLHNFVLEFKDFCFQVIKNSNNQTEKLDFKYFS